MLEQLQNIFPNMTRDMLLEAIESSITIYDAIDHVLEKNDAEMVDAGKPSLKLLCE